MGYEERKNVILNELEFCGSLSFQEIAKIVDVAPTTIRRDLARMSEEGVIERYHGGIKAVSEVTEYSMRRKQSMNKDAKRRIAQMAATFLVPNELVFIGGGSTTYSMIEFISEPSISVITNSIPHAEALHRRGIRTFLLCGFLRTRTRCLGGDEMISLMRQYRFDQSFMGTGGVGEGLKLLSSDQNEFDLKNIALENSQQSYILVDATKFGLTAMYETDISCRPNVTLITNRKELAGNKQGLLCPNR